MAPATKGDLRALEKRMDARSAERFGWMHDDIGRVLDVLINLEKRLAPKIDDHERRITRLEEVVA